MIFFTEKGFSAMPQQLFQVQIGGSIFGQGWMNVFFYRTEPTDPIVPADEVALSFDQNYQADWPAFVTNDCKFDYIDVKDLFNPSNQIIISPSWGQGLVSGSQSLQSFLQHSFQFPTITNVIKSGGKRIAGANEDWYADGLLNPPPAMVTALNEFMLDMLFALVVPDGLGGTVPLFHTVVKRILTNPGGASPVYRLPEDATEMTVYDVTTVEYNGISTQNTRKPEVLSTPYGI